MAQFRNNPIMHGASGMLGNVVVFRQVGGKTVMANRPRKPRFQSQRQKEHRLRFKQAVNFARTAVRDQQKKEYYKAIAPKLGVTNAYTAALTMYMRTGGKPHEIAESKLPVPTRIVVTPRANSIQAALLVMVCFWIAFLTQLKAMLQNQAAIVIWFPLRNVSWRLGGIVDRSGTERRRMVFPLGGHEVTRQMTPG